MVVNPFISIITVNYNQSEVTKQLLDSLDKISYQNYEVFVVDNGSKEPIYLADNYPEVSVIYAKENLGFAGGNNLAVQQAKGDAILFINNDVEVCSDFLEPLVSRLFLNRDIAVVSPKIKFYDKPSYIQYAGSTKISPFTIRNETIGYNELDNGQYNEPRTTHYAHGAAMLVKSSVIKQVGMMEPKFFLYYEEIDWCERIKKNKYKIWYEPNSKVFHKESVSTGKCSPLKTYYLNRNRLFYALRNFSFFYKMIAIPFYILVALPKNMFQYLVRFQFQHIISLVRSVNWNIKNLF